MTEQLDLILHQSCGLHPDLPIVVGVSGGPDSLCLLDVMHQAGYCVIVAHFNHKLRPEADLEQAAVSELAHRLNLPFVTESVDVHKFAEREMLSIEEAARTLRYRFLFTQARKHGAQAVAVGHTADDQVETVLMHFLRGAGLAGLKGMSYRSTLPTFDIEIPLVRPLLSLWREETEAYCRAHGLTPHFDPSNTDQTYFRNKLRHALIPELEKYNPRFKEALTRTAQALQGDSDALEEVVSRAWEPCLVEHGEGFVAFEREKMVNLSVGLRRNLIRRAGELLRPESRDFGFEALERAATFVEVSPGKQIDFVNGLYLFQESGKVYLATYEADLPFAQWPQVSRESLVVSGQYELGNGWVLTVENCLLDTEDCPLDTDNWSLNTDNWSAWLDADLMPNRLTVRPRRSGDRFQPFGMDGQSVKLSDFFVNVKLPKRAREHWPLVCVGDEIAWVPGYRLAHPFCVTEKTRRVLHLALRHE
jgi:tRNA(Ile)-lysidine synthase